MKRAKIVSKKFRRFAAAFAAAAVLSAALPLSASAAPVAYDGLIATGNTTEFKKVLELSDTESIPEVSFDYKVTAPDNDVAAVYDTDGKMKTFAVFKGPTPEKIKYKLMNTAENGTDFVRDNNTGYTDATLKDEEENVVGFTVAYAPQEITALPENNTSIAAPADDVLLYNKVYSLATAPHAEMDTYYAIKDVQLDFSACDFKEPGIYRYYIEETGGKTGIINDYGRTGENVAGWRTLDVYVEDATETPTGATEPEYKLKIAGFIMYVGKLTTGPAAVPANPYVQENGGLLEDGMANTNPISGYGIATGNEVYSDETHPVPKSEGIKNLYDVSDLTFRKTVSGNQASRDKFFKFTIKLIDDDENPIIDDEDEFIVNSDIVVDSSYKDKTDTPNGATAFTMGQIYNANAIVTGASDSNDDDDNTNSGTGSDNGDETGSDNNGGTVSDNGDGTGSDNNGGNSENIPSGGSPSAEEGSGDTGSGDSGSGDTGSGDSGSGDTGSGDSGSGDSGSGDSGSGDSGSEDTGSGDSGSGDSGSGDSGSGDTGSGESEEPSDTTPVVRKLTGKQLKEGYSFYLQGGQFVTIENIPNGVGYVLYEEQDGYTPAVSLLHSVAGHAYDDTYYTDDPTTLTQLGQNSLVITSAEGSKPATASITDNEITADVDVTFTNSREGILPTGVLLSIGAPIIIAVLLIGAIIFLVLRNRKRELEGEESKLPDFWKKMNILYELLVLIALVLVLLVVSWCIYDSYYVYSHTLDESIAIFKPGTIGSVAPGDSPITDDMVAWLTIDGTNIDYPVMQAADNVKYLNTDPFGKYSLSGSIYLDSRCNADFSDSYSLIYGHHMEYGKMFGALDDFLSETYMKAHSTGTLMVGRNAEETYDLVVFASMKASAKDKAVFDPGSSDIVSFIESKATLNTLRGQIPDGSRIIALSTCAESDSVSRIVVFCYIL